MNPERVWNPIQGIQEPSVIRQFAGISGQDAFSLPDEVMVKNKNISTKNMPAAKAREGFASLASITGKTTGIGSYKEKELIAISGGVWRKWDTSVWTDIKTGLDVDAKWSFTNFVGNFGGVRLLAANGKDSVKVYNGTTLTNLSGAPSGMNYIVGHENRLYGAVKNELHYSALRNPTDWNTVDESGQIVIENDGGEDISAMIAGTGKVVVFMPHSIHELYGTGPINYRLQLITEEVGCVSHHSAVMVSGVLYFLSHDGVYRYTGGAVPKKDFSLAIQPIIERVNTAAWSEVVAGTDSERYYISLPIDGATTPNITLEYDPMYDVWNIWDFGFVPTAYGRIDEKMYVGATDKVVQMGGSSDDGTPTPYMMETKPFSFGSLATHSRLYRLWLVADVPTGSTMNIYLSNDRSGDGSWELVKSITADDDVKSTPIYIPVDKSFHHHWTRLKIEGVGPVTIHELSRQERVFRFGIGGV